MALLCVVPVMALAYPCQWSLGDGQGAGGMAYGAVLARSVTKLRSTKKTNLTKCSARLRTIRSTN